MVRFNALDIFLTPAFFFANDFNSRTSDEVHARRTNFFFFIPAPFFVNRASITPDSVCNASQSRQPIKRFWMNQIKLAGTATPQANSGDRCEGQTTQFKALKVAADSAAMAALASSQAAALRMNNTLSTINTTIRQGAASFTNDFVTGLEQGDSALQALQTAAANLQNSAHGRD
jgi:hypothetical protein